MIPSYKIKSKLTNIIVILAGLIVYIGKDELAKILPAECAYLAPAIVLIAGYFAIQGTEDTRVKRAEKRAVDQYAQKISQEPNAPTISGADQID